MTNLVDVRNNKIYCGVTGINQVRFQQGSDSCIIIDFKYNGGNAIIEIYVNGKGVTRNNKAPLLIEVNELVNSIFNIPGEYATVEKIAENINNIEITDWARDFIK